MRTESNSSPNASYGPGGDGAAIAYAIADSALGRLLVAGTRRGICFAAMGEADSTLIAELRRDYPRATIRVADPNRRADARIGQWADALADYVAGRSQDAGAADGHPRHSVSVCGLGSVARDSGRRDAIVFRDRAAYRTPARNPRRRHRQRRKSGVDCHPMSSRDSRVGASRRLSMGIGSQAQVVGDGVEETQPLTPSRAGRGTGFYSFCSFRTCLGLGMTSG